MLFHIFNSQEERRAFNGSAFIEIQFCKLPSGTSKNKIMAVKNIRNWRNDSLYISDIDLFYDAYSCIFSNDDELIGNLDIFSINYYNSELIQYIIDKLFTMKPIDYEVFIEWFNKAKVYNSFYILGI